MIKGIDLDTIYLMDSMHHYPFVAEFPRLKKTYPKLSEQNICFYLGRDKNDKKNIAVLFNFDLETESDLNKSYAVQSWISENTILLVISPDTDKKAQSKHQLFYGWSITNIRAKQASVSYGYKVANITDEFKKTWFFAKGYLQVGDILNAPKGIGVILETIGRKPYLINYTKPVTLIEANKLRPQTIFMNDSKYSGPSRDAFTYLLPALAPLYTKGTAKPVASNNTVKKTTRKPVADNTAVKKVVKSKPVAKKPSKTTKK